MLAAGVEEVALVLVPGEHHTLLQQTARQLAVPRLLAVDEPNTGEVCDGAGTLEELVALRPQLVWKLDV